MDPTISSLIAVIVVLFLIILIGVVTVHQITRDISDDFPEDEANEEDDAETQANNILDEVLDEWHKISRMDTESMGLVDLRWKLNDLEDQIFSNADKNPDREANMRAEAIQLAAMALRFITDVSDHQDSFVSEEITQEIPAKTLESLKMG